MSKKICGLELREVSSTPTRTSLWTYKSPKGFTISFWANADNTWQIDLEYKEIGLNLKVKGASEDEVIRNFDSTVELFKGFWDLGNEEAPT